MHPRTRSVLACLLAGTLVACAPPAEDGPAPQPSAATPEPSPSPVVTTAEQAALTIALAQLRTTVEATRTALEATAAGQDRAGEAVALLVADPGVVTGRDADVVAPLDPAQRATERPGTEPPDPDARPAPLLPGPETSREETVTYGDLLTGLLAASRQAGGRGEPVQRLLADPVAGDLGSWQRAPSDLLALIAAAAATESLEEAEPLVLALDGEAPRALAWAALAVRAPALASGAAERALAHMAIIEVALADLAA
jgi:hypothetical protein